MMTKFQEIMKRMIITAARMNDDDDGDCSGWYQHHDEAGDYNGWYQYHDEAGDYNSWYQHHEEDDEHNGLDQQYAPVQNLYLAADNHDHALNLTLNEAPSKNLNQNQPEEVAHTENLLAADNDDPIQNFLATNNHHPIQNFLAADNHNHNHACFFLLIEELEDKQRLIQNKITKLEQKLEDYKREMDVIDSHMENLSSQEVDDDEVSRNNEEDDDYNCCQNDDDDDDGDCSGWYQHHDEAGDYNGWYQYHDEAGDYNSWYQHHEEDDEHNGLDQQYAPVQNLYLAADNHDHALNLTLNEAPSKNLNQNQPEEVAHTENLLAADNDDPIQNFLAANNHHPIQNFLAADNHNHNHACFCAFSQVDDDEVSRNNEEDDDYNCCQNEDDDDDGDCSGWYQQRDEAGDYNGWYQYHDEADNHDHALNLTLNEAPSKNLNQNQPEEVAHTKNLLAADNDDHNHDHALNLTLNDAPSKNLNQNQPEEVAHTENLLATDNDDPIQNFLAANNHHPILNFLVKLMVTKFQEIMKRMMIITAARMMTMMMTVIEAVGTNIMMKLVITTVGANITMKLNLYPAVDNHDHAVNLTLNQAPSKNLNQNQPEEVAHTENLLAADNDDPIQNFLAANNHHPIQNFLAADNHNHNHACFCAFSSFLVLETAYLYDLLFLEFAKVDVDEVSRNNEEDDDYNCCQNEDDDDDGDYSGWYQHHDEAAGDYNSWYQHHEEDDEHNGLDQQYAPVQNLYLAVDNHDHALNLTLNEAPSKNLNQNQPEEVAHTENLLAADNDDPIQNFLAANNHHPIQNFLTADNHNHNHACFCAFSRFFFLLIEELEDKQRLIQKKITKLEQKLEDYKREMDVIDSHMENLSRQEVDDDEVSRNNEEDDDYNCSQNDDDDDDGDCSGWYQHHEEAGDYKGWFQYHDEADNHDHALNLTLNEAPSKNLNQNQPEEVAHTENLLATDNDDPIQNFLAAKNHHPIQNFLAADNHNHNHACFCAFSRFLVLETAYLYDLLFLEFAKVDDYKVSRNNEEDDDYNCCQNYDDDDDGDYSGWYQHHDEAGDYNGLYQYHDEAASSLRIGRQTTSNIEKDNQMEQKLEDYKREMDVIDSHMENLSSQEVDDDDVFKNSEEDDDYNCCQNDDDEMTVIVAVGTNIMMELNLYLAVDNHDHALNLTLNEAPSKNLNQNQPEEVAHTESLLATDNDDPIQNFLAANNHHPIQNFLAADNHNHSHACFYAFSLFLVLETAYLYDLLFLEFAKFDDDDVSRNNEEDDDYYCFQNHDDDDDGDCSGWYQHHDEAGDYNGWYQYHDEAGDYNTCGWYQYYDEAGDYNGWYQYHDEAGDYNSWYQHHEEDDEHNGLDQHLLIEELEDKQRLIQKKITKLEQKLEDYKREIDVIDSHMENLSSQEVDDDEVSRNNEEDDDYRCCQNDDDGDDGDCSGWYQHHDEAGDYNGWYQYHDEAGDYNSWYQHHEEDDEHNGLDQQYAHIQNLYLAADNHDHAVHLTLHEAPSKNLNKNQPEEVAHTENLLAADNDDPIQNFLLQKPSSYTELSCRYHNHNHACFCAFSRFLVLETAYLYDLLFLNLQVFILLIEELEDKQRLIQKKITKLEQKLEDYKREIDVIDSHMENLSSQEVDDDEVSRNNEEDDDYRCCQNDDDGDDGDCSGWYQHHDEAGDYNGWYQYHDGAGDYNSWYQHHEKDDEHNGLDQQYAPVQNLYLAADNHDHALNLTLNEAPSKNLNQNQPEEVAHTENLLSADNDDPIQNFLAANNHSYTELSCCR
ncbi:hypothetical protein KIW84_031737 [Lathyrus oleraceus]|uniref:Uncharacterized protein n=1 Tax=Pisum sativum TaxID=3888 RepID=A0A9D4XS17_PEA|nr:hypothetical protein KIW84_031737 [Pisum sativum]